MDERDFKSVSFNANVWYVDYCHADCFADSGYWLKNEVIMKNLINKTLVSDAGLEAVILRIPIRLILAAHGSQKLFA